MSYQVLARKWRPRRFSEMVGQEHVVRALGNALERDRLHHAYLFSGTRGVGKTTLARIFAKSLNCEQGVTAAPCGTCPACREIDEGRFVDLLEVDAASRTKVDQTRELLDNVPYAPVCGRYKVYLIDEVHMFSGSSFNALLKTLEEPPPHVKFLLATTDPQKVPVTVLSRCLQFILKRLLPEQIRGQLAHILAAEGIDYEIPALSLLARAADGSMRDGLSLLDQAIAFGAGRVCEADVRSMLGTIARGLVLDLGEALATGDPAGVLGVVAQMAERTPDFADVLAELLALLHRLAVGQMLPDLLQGGDTEPREQTLAGTLPPEDIQLYYQIGLLGQRDLELAPDPRTGLEMVLLRMLAFRPAGGQPGAGPRAVTPRQRVDSRPGVVTHPAPTAPAPASQGAEAGPPRLRDNEDWHALVGRLGLRGISGQLAGNCELESWDGRTLRLRLDASGESLRAVSTEERLAAALREVLGPQLRVDLHVAPADAETPAQRDTRRRAERSQEARHRLTEDPVLQSLQETFDAELLSDSVRPLERPDSA
jgi:DNA polymerase III subunit gamma/tau